jgi:hypothetical protein
VFYDCNASQGARDGATNTRREGGDWSLLLSTQVRLPGFLGPTVSLRACRGGGGGGGNISIP